MKKDLPSFRIDLLHRSVLIALFSNSFIFATCANADGLPPPPRDVSEVNQLFKLYLDLVVNGYPTQQVIPVIVKGDEYFIERKRFDDLTITLPNNAIQQGEQAKNSEGGLSDTDIFTLGFSGQASEWIALNQIPEIKYTYASDRQFFSLDVPASWMPTQMLGRDSWYTPEKAESGVGFLNNYDFYAYKPQTGGYSSTLFTEQRFFSPYGVFKNSGIYTKTDIDNNLSEENNQNQDGYRRYDTSWQYDDPERVMSIVLGDVISGNKNSWGSSIRLGGLQLRRNFGTRPDLITYPLPQFKGQAAVPSTIDLLINGQQSTSTDVQSGPFVLNNVPFINGKGEAVIVTTDTVGRQVSTTVPFYISNTLLKPKLFDYSLSLGQVRKDYGIKDFSYGNFAASADARYGINDWLTAEGRAEFANDVQVVGLGSVIKLKNFGVLNGSLSGSLADQSLFRGRTEEQKGYQYTVGYGYNQNRFGFSVNYSDRDREYSDLSSIQYADLISVNSQQSIVANTYFATEKSGTFGVAYLQTKSNDLENKLMNLSWAPVLPSYMRGATVSLSSNYDFVENDWSAAFQLSIPMFGRSSTANVGYTAQNSGDSAYVNLNRSVPTQGGVGFDLTHRYNENGNNFNQGRISHRNQYFNTDFGISGDRDYSYWFGLSGSVILMSGDVFATNRLGESFALIDTNKVKDVPVLYENNLIGRSNSKGFVFVPSVTPYYAVKYSINPLDLDSNYNVKMVENRKAAKLGSGIVVKFPVKKSYAANVYLIQDNGKVVPTGAVVHRQDHESTYVGVDGIVYLENLSASNSVRVQLPDDRVCEADFNLDLQQAEQNIVVIKSVSCREVDKP